jgi:hypothetical protein
MELDELHADEVRADVGRRGACPSPVYSHELLLMRYARPIAAGRETTAFVRNTTKRPVSRGRRGRR